MPDDDVGILRVLLPAFFATGRDNRRGEQQKRPGNRRAQLHEKNSLAWNGHQGRNVSAAPNARKKTAFAHQRVGGRNEEGSWRMELHRIAFHPPSKTSTP